MSTYHAEAEKGRAYVGKDCTINGHPAQIVGRKNLFATVRAFDTPISVEYAWPTVARVMQNGGTFRA